MNRCFAGAPRVSRVVRAACHAHRQPHRTRTPSVIVLVGLALLPTRALGTPLPAPRETFSIDYTVAVRASDPTTATVRWELAGIDEIRRIRLTADARFHSFEASGRLERQNGEIIWWPDAPYGHLTYGVHLRHRRAPEKGFDAWAERTWVLVRARDLFPRSAVLFATSVEANPEARARLRLRVPERWDVASPLPPDGPHRFVVESPRARFDHPRGWLMLGRFARTDAAIAGTTVTVATADEATSARRILALLQDALPELQHLLARTPAHLLIALAPDPMWRGGLSASDSFYMHGDRPLQTPDGTSPYLHALFHVFDPTRPGPDAAWVREGLAEFYSVEIQRRIGLLDEPAFRRALRSFARHGRWQRDLTRTSDFALRNNSAPLVMWALDREIRDATDDVHGLDDVVTALARQGGVVTTARFLGTVRRIADTSFNGFFRRHVYRGEPPSLARLDALDRRAGEGTAAAREP